MLTATVIGNVWATRRLDGLPNGAFLEVEAEGSGQRLIAFDVLGSGPGERVLVVQGSVAAAWFTGKAPALANSLEPAHSQTPASSPAPASSLAPPIDALIIGSIDTTPDSTAETEQPHG
jgi:ethanolamine utilization protein EutN